MGAKATGRPIAKVRFMGEVEAPGGAIAGRPPGGRMLPSLPLHQRAAGCAEIEASAPPTAIGDEHAPGLGQTAGDRGQGGMGGKGGVGCAHDLSHLAVGGRENPADVGPPHWVAHAG